MLYEKSVTEQNEANLIQLSNEEIQDVNHVSTPARHTVDVTLAADFDGIKFIGLDGVTRTASLGSSAIADPDALELAIFEAVVKAYRNNGMGCKSKIEYGDNGGVRVRDIDGANKRITIDANIEVVAMLNGVTETALTRLTVPVMATILQITHAVGAQGNLTYDGSDEALGSHATTEGAALATAVETALGNLSVDYGTVTVTESDDNTTFTITAEVAQKPILYDGVQMSRIGGLRMWATVVGGGLAGQLEVEEEGE